MHNMNFYLNFKGNTEQVFEFYRSVLGGEFKILQRFSETPHGEHLPEHEKSMIMHVSLPINDSLTLMGSDVLESMGFPYVAGNNFSISLNPSTRAEGARLFEALSVNGQVTMPLEDTFWGAYFGMFKDQFGIQWMINVEER
jgi:PhnB protein